MFLVAVLVALFLLVTLLFQQFIDICALNVKSLANRLDFLPDVSRI